MNISPTQWNNDGEKVQSIANGVKGNGVLIGKKLATSILIKNKHMISKWKIVIDNPINICQYCEESEFLKHSHKSCGSCGMEEKPSLYP